LPRESKRAKRERTLAIIERLKGMYPESKCSLTHENPLQLLVATVLSAQCTDARQPRHPGALRPLPHGRGLRGGIAGRDGALLASINFFRNKSKSVIGLGQALVERHGGEVPVDLEALTKLPGVGRKTANVLLGVGFGIADGVVVDTHVKRIANRWGLTREEDPERIERDLLPLVPPEERVHFTHRTIDHGRAVCTARRAYCERCALASSAPPRPPCTARRRPMPPLGAEQAGQPAVETAATTAGSPPSRTRHRSESPQGGFPLLLLRL
jgi:endonuclease-3